HATSGSDRLSATGTDRSPAAARAAGAGAARLRDDEGGGGGVGRFAAGGAGVALPDDLPAGAERADRGDLVDRAGDVAGAGPAVLPDDEAGRSGGSGGAGAAAADPGARGRASRADGDAMSDDDGGQRGPFARLLALLLRLHPADFRERYAAEVLSAFRDG